MRSPSRCGSNALETGFLSLSQSYALRTQLRREFQSPDFERMGELMREKTVFDGRNLYMPARMRKYGFRYFRIGRPDVT